MQPRFVYLACKNKEEALIVGENCVQERLAACANIFESMTSIYWWEGELVKDEEAVLVLKTEAQLMGKLIDKVKSIHSYDVPCIVALPILEGNPAYLQWIVKETQINL